MDGMQEAVRSLFLRRMGGRDQVYARSAAGFMAEPHADLCCNMNQLVRARDLHSQGEFTVPAPPRAYAPVMRTDELGVTAISPTEPGWSRACLLVET